jgi:hypothetical protein
MPSKRWPVYWMATRQADPHCKGANETAPARQGAVKVKGYVSGGTPGAPSTPIP